MNYQTNKIMYLQLILGIILPCKNEYSEVVFVVRISSNFAKISGSVSVSHLVRLVYLRREMDYLSYVFKSSGSSNNSAHVSNRLVSRDKKQTLLLDERASKKIKITNEIIIPFEKLSFGNLVFFFLQRLKSSQAHFPK